MCTSYVQPFPGDLRNRQASGFREGLVPISRTPPAPGHLPADLLVFGKSMEGTPLGAEAGRQWAGSEDPGQPFRSLSKGNTECVRNWFLKGTKKENI